MKKRKVQEKDKPLTPNQARVLRFLQRIKRATNDQIRCSTGIPETSVFQTVKMLTIKGLVVRADNEKPFVHKVTEKGMNTDSDVHAFSRGKVRG